MGPRFEEIACSTKGSISTNDKNSLRELEQILLKWLPETVHLVNICRIMIQERFPKTAHVQLYGYVEDEASNWKNGKECPFIVCIERPNIHTKKGIILLSPQEIRRPMIEAFDALIGWDEPQRFHSVPHHFAPALRELFTLHGNVKSDDSEIPAVISAILDIDQAKELELTFDSNTITVRQLKQKDVAQIAQFWKWWVQTDAEKEIGETIKTLPSCGAFSEDGEMLSSILISSLGLLNLMHTPEKFRGKGYGHLVMRGVAKYAAEQLGIYPVAETEEVNEASFRTMAKVGFEKLYKSRWFTFTPSTTTASRTEGHH